MMRCRTIIAWIAVTACNPTTVRDGALLGARLDITYLGTDFTRASIHDPLFDRRTFTAARVRSWSDLVSVALRAALPELGEDRSLCDTGNAAFAPTARLFDPRDWRPAELDPTTARERIARWVDPKAGGLGLVVSLERVNAEDRLSAMVIIFQRSSGRIALAERVRATLDVNVPRAFPSALDLGLREEPSLIANEYRPHFEALAAHVTRVLLAARTGD